LDFEHVALLCESVDERQVLRERVMGPDPDVKDRAALRAVDAQVTAMLSALGLNPAGRQSLAVPAGSADAAASKFAQARARAKS
jgi:phage terminase small subunit